MNDNIFWLNNRVISEDDVKALERAAAKNEIIKKLDIKQAEEEAYKEYKADAHKKAAAYHLSGLRAALDKDDKESHKKHLFKLILHQKELGHNPDLDPTEDIVIHVKPIKDYQKYSDHKADCLLTIPMHKSETELQTPIKAFIIWKTDFLHENIERLTIHNEKDGLAIFNQELTWVKEGFENWALENNGKCILTTSGCGVLESCVDVVTTIPSLIEKFNELSFTFSIGVGMSLHEAAIAVKYAHISGGQQMAFYESSMRDAIAEHEEKKLNEKEELKGLVEKSLVEINERLQKDAESGKDQAQTGGIAGAVGQGKDVGSEKGGGQPKESGMTHQRISTGKGTMLSAEKEQRKSELKEEIKQTVNKAIQDIKANKAALEKLKEINANAYQAVREVVHAMFQMADQLLKAENLLEEDLSKADDESIIDKPHIDYGYDQGGWLGHTGESEFELPSHFQAKGYDLKLHHTPDGAIGHVYQHGKFVGGVSFSGGKFDEHWVAGQVPEKDLDISTRMLVNNHFSQMPIKSDYDKAELDIAVPPKKTRELEKEQFDPKELETGIQHEMEHTTDPAIAEEIAKDHLREDPKYYTKLVLIGHSNLNKAHKPENVITRIYQKRREGAIVDGQNARAIQSAGRSPLTGEKLPMGQAEAGKGAVLSNETGRAVSGHIKTVDDRPAESWIQMHGYQIPSNVLPQNPIPNKVLPETKFKAKVNKSESEPND